MQMRKQVRPISGGRMGRAREIEREIREIRGKRERESESESESDREREKERERE